MPEESHDEQGLAQRQAEVAAAMDETLDRQRDVRRRQDALLAELGRIERALDRRADSAGDEPRE